MKNRFRPGNIASGNRVSLLISLLVFIFCSFALVGQLDTSTSDKTNITKENYVRAQLAPISEMTACTPPARSSARTRPSPDSDGDGVINAVEVADGTNPNDSGSFRQHLTSPIYALWTGFLEIIPILEIINPGDTDLTVRVSLLDSSGAVQSSMVETISPGAQRDLIIRDMQGFVADNYGLVQIDFCGSTIDGRVSYYRTKSDGSFEFAFSGAISQPSYGNTAVGFNTFSPSRNPAELDYSVPNWLSIVNLSSSSKSFTISRYNQQGDSLGSSSITIPNGGRFDVQGGHQDPGANFVGLLKIIPADKSAPYIATLTRFGNNAPATEQPTGFNFAFPLNAKAGSGERLSAPLTTTLSSDNWLEVINTLSQETTTTIDLYNSDGDRVSRQVKTLAPYAQEHLYVNELLGNDQIGHAEVKATLANSVIAQSMVYTLDSEGRVLNMYGSQARHAIGDSLSGSYNLFLDMDNLLKLSNTKSSQVTVTLEVESASGTTELSTTLPAKSSKQFEVHDFRVFKTVVDTFGLVRVTAPANSKILGELLRARRNRNLEVEFIFPTEIRDTSDSTTYTIGGTITGLSGTLVLKNNGANSLSRSANGSFQFSSPALKGSAYNATITSQPTGQNCSVTNGSGTANGNVTNISVSCVSLYSIGFTVNGLDGTVVLQNNGSDDKTVITDGTYPFITELQSGSAYDVTILSEPAGQDCSVTNGSGTASGDVTNIAIDCVSFYSVGFTVSGLDGTVVLQNNGGDNKSVSTNGAYTFTQQIQSGSPYNVTVLSQPAEQTCSVSNGSGTMGSSDVTNVGISCADLPTPTITIDNTRLQIFPYVGIIAKTNGDANFNILTTSDSAGAFTFTSSDTNVATISGNTVTILNAGTTTITANQASSGGFLAGSESAELLVVFNACDASPCQNGGTCNPAPSIMNGPNDSYLCACNPPYSGATCESSDLNCSTPGTCINGGTCVASPSGGECSCPVCYMGNRCQNFDAENCA